MVNVAIVRRYNGLITQLVHWENSRITNENIVTVTHRCCLQES